MPSALSERLLRSTKTQGYVYSKDYPATHNPAVALIKEAEGRMRRALRSPEVESILNARKLDVGELSRVINSKTKEEISGLLRDVSDRRMNILQKKLGSSVLSDRDISRIVKAQARKTKQLFLGKTLGKRIGIVNKRFAADLNSFTKAFSGRDDFRQMLARFLKSKRAYQFKARLLVSEGNRINQDIVRETGDHLSDKGYIVRYRWILSTLPGRKWDICDVYADKKYFTQRTLPQYPHPFCYCHVEIATAEAARKLTP
jgi:hypothetical protein